MNINEAFSKLSKVLKRYVDEQIAEESEEETLDTLLEYGLVSDALMLDDGTYLADSDGTLIQL